MVIIKDSLSAVHNSTAAELTDENYIITLNLIKDRYDNNRIIVYSHTKEIFESPKMTKEYHQQMKALIDGAAKHLGLENRREAEL